MSATIRLLEPADAPVYRDVRLRMLELHPDAFTSSHVEDAKKPLAWVEDRLRVRSDGPTRFVLGAFSADGALVGSVGLAAEERAKQRHKADLFGMFTTPEARGQGVGRALLDACISRARETPGLEQVILTVTDGNPAERLYAAAGFERFGVEPRAIRVGDQYHGKVHMILFLRARP